MTRIFFYWMKHFNVFLIKYFEFIILSLVTSVWPWPEPSKNLVPTIKPIQVVWNKKTKYNFIRYFIDYRCLLNHLKIYKFIIMAAIFLKTIIFSSLRCYKNKNKHIYELIEKATIAMCLLNLKKKFEWNPSNRFCVIPGTSSKNATLGKRHSKIWNKKERLRKTKRGRVRQQITIELLNILQNPFVIIFLTLYRWEICKKKNRFFQSDEPEDPLNTTRPKHTFFHMIWPTKHESHIQKSTT